MAGKAKSCYLSVTNRETRKTVLNRMFFKMAELNDFIKKEEFKATYPEELFHIVKEIY
jgi:hypothetical protein|tara:strand:- start:525 stop:698 length:174 start_codon:yes stop_codon:yes gene_type:complete